MQVGYSLRGVSLLVAGRTKLYRGFLDKNMGLKNAFYIVLALENFCSTDLPFARWYNGRYLLVRHGLKKYAPFRQRLAATAIVISRADGPVWTTRSLSHRVTCKGSIPGGDP